METSYMNQHETIIPSLYYTACISYPPPEYLSAFAVCLYGHFLRIVSLSRVQL